MDYHKVDAPLAAAVDEIENAEEPTLAVFIYTAKSRDETARGDGARTRHGTSTFLHKICLGTSTANRPFLNPPVY